MTGTTRVIGAVGFMGAHLFESLLDAGEHVVTEDDLICGLIENVPEVAAFGNHRTMAGAKAIWKPPMKSNGHGMA